MSDGSYLYYIPTQQQDGGAGKYHGAVAQGYDQKREESLKYKVEQSAIEGMLDDMPAGNWVLDVPCGTGRFFGFYHRKGYIFRGVDASADMLRLAANKVVDPMTARLAHGDVRSLPLEDKSVDASVMCRLTRWLEPNDCVLAMKELQRVTRDRIILTARVANHPHARPLELFESALEPGWSLAQNAQGSDPDYRILMFKRSGDAVADK